MELSDLHMSNMSYKGGIEEAALQKTSEPQAFRKESEQQGQETKAPP